MISLTVILIVFVAGTLVFLFLKHRSIVGWMMNLIAGDNSASAKVKNPGTADPNYTNILQKRFENGEITEAEYEKMKDELG